MVRSGATRPGWYLTIIDLKRLWARFVDYGLQNRFGWALENVAEALGQCSSRLSSHDARPLRQAERSLRNVLAVRAPVAERLPDALETGGVSRTSGPGWEVAFPDLDVLGGNALSWKTINTLWASADPISRRWGVISNLRLQDFCDALVAGLNLKEITNSNDPV